jgi:hypothetical protein
MVLLVAVRVKQDFQSNPKEAWNNIFKLMEGFQSHHKNSVPKNLKDSHGKEAATNDQNLKIISDHCKKGFNNHAQIDPTVIDEIPQLPIQCEIGDAPTLNEIKKSIKHMKNNRTPGTSKVTTDRLKNLPPEGFELLLFLIKEYWTNPEIIFTSWQTPITSGASVSKELQPKL